MDVKWEQSVRCKTEDEILQHLIFFQVFFGGQLENDV